VAGKSPRTLSSWRQPHETALIPEARRAGDIRAEPRDGADERVWEEGRGADGGRHEEDVQRKHAGTNDTIVTDANG
jgi:hypothetical protein